MKDTALSGQVQRGLMIALTPGRGREFDFDCISVIDLFKYFSGENRTIETNLCVAVTIPKLVVPTYTTSPIVSPGPIKEPISIVSVIDMSTRDI